MITTMIMITPMALPKCWGSTARQTPARRIPATVMITAMAMITAMPAIPMITPPT